MLYVHTCCPAGDTRSAAGERPYPYPELRLVRKKIASAVAIALSTELSAWPLVPCGTYDHASVSGPVTLPSDALVRRTSWPYVVQSSRTAITATCACAAFVSLTAVSDTLPGAMPVTVPEADTVAMFVSDDVNEIGRPVSTLPCASCNSTVNASVLPTLSFPLGGVIAIVAP